ncbi:MAG TPA: caspase family protein [Candidatus Obscuribacterales bacterium]
MAYDSNKSSLFASGIELQDLTQLMKDRVETERVLVVLDACHSGSADANAKALFREANFDAAVLAGSGQMVICSSGSDQRSWESSRYANGVFTKKLMEALTKDGDKTRLQGAFQYLKDEVQTEVREDRAVKQIPVLKSQWNGDDLQLAAPPAHPRPLPQSVLELLQPDSKTAQAVQPKK